MSWLRLKKYNIEITVITLHWNIIYVFKIFRKAHFTWKHKLYDTKEILEIVYKLKQRNIALVVKTFITHL